MVDEFILTLAMKQKNLDKNQNPMLTQLKLPLIIKL